MARCCISIDSQPVGTAVALWLLAFASVHAEVNVQGLRCEYRLDPLGIDTPRPRLSWLLESLERGQAQSAYQVLAAAAPENLAEGKAALWDSGKVDSGESIHIIYGGKPLRSSQRVYWKVRAWDNAGKSSAWSRPEFWEMAATTRRRCFARSSCLKRRFDAPGFTSAASATTNYF